MKLCNRCLQEKPLTEFHRNRRNVDGRYSYCKPCKLDQEKRQRMARSPERVKEEYAAAVRRQRRARRVRRLGLVSDAQRIMAWFKDQGVSNRELAKLSGLDRTTLRRIPEYPLGHRIHRATVDRLQEAQRETINRRKDPNRAPGKREKRRSGAAG